VLRDIRNLISKGIPKEYADENFKTTTYIEEQNGQEYIEYLLTLPAFLLLTAGYTCQRHFHTKIEAMVAYKQAEESLK